MDLTFKEQYAHPNWQRKRLEVMEAAGFACESCSDKDTTLNVHHKRYVKGRMVWEYERSELECLCEPCHLAVTIENDSLKNLLAAIDSAGELGPLIDLMSGWLDASRGERFEFIDARDYDNPHVRLAGAISRLLIRAPHATLVSLNAALTAAPWWIYESAAQRFVDELVLRVGEPRPVQPQPKEL